MQDTVCAQVLTRPAAVRVDLGGVAFLGAAGLRALQRAQLLADDAGVHLVVDPGASRAVRRAFAVLDRLGAEPFTTA
ncbi:STAS domain-containing protein [Amycolatopsis sp. NPDC004378]